MALLGCVRRVIPMKRCVFCCALVAPKKKVLYHILIGSLTLCEEGIIVPMGECFFCCTLNPNNRQGTLIGSLTTRLVCVREVQ